MTSVLSPISKENVCAFFLTSEKLPVTPEKLKGIDLGTPTKIKKVSDIRQRHLDFAQASDTPIKNSEKVPYGEHELSRMAYEHKLANNIPTGRNVSVAESVSPMSKRVKRVIFSTDGPPGTTPHSELSAADINTDNITDIYSDREPCRRCRRKLKIVLPPTAKLFYSIPYSDDPVVQRVNEQKFRQLQASLGVREPKPRKAKKS
jgi:Xanthomonas XOO_2897-like deaminase